MKIYFDNIEDLDFSNCAELSKNINNGHWLTSSGTRLKRELQQLKIPYLITYSMLSSWEQDIENRNITPDQFSLLYNTPRIYRNDSFMSFVVHKSLPVGPENHPLEEGHKQWANILLNYIKTNDLLNNKDL
jgi:hypothetical protein